MSHEEGKDPRPRRNRVTNATRQGAARTGYVIEQPQLPEKEIVKASTIREDIPSAIEYPPPPNLLSITPESLRPQLNVPQAGSINSTQSPMEEKTETNSPAAKWEPLLAMVRRLVLCLGLLVTALAILYPNGSLTTSAYRRSRARSIDYPSYTTTSTSTNYGRRFVGTPDHRINKLQTVAEALISLSFTLGIIWALRPPRSKKEK